MIARRLGFLVLLIHGSATTVVGQTPATARRRPVSGRDFPAALFDSVSRTAAFLAAYDQVAWVTTDSLLPIVRADSALRRRMGRDWFAVERDSTWHAVYGRYDATTDRFDQVFHYAARPGATFHRVDAPLDSALATRFARALTMTRGRLPAPVVQSRALFNAYVRPRDDGSLDVWYLPAWQQSGWLLYGMELRYHVDPTGRTLLDSSAVIEPLRGAQPDTTRELTIANDARDLPTVGQAFFTMYYGRYFSAVYVRSRDFVSRFYDKGGTRAWMHAVRPGATAAPDTTR